MGRRDKRFSKSLHQQAYDRFVGMQAFGESKRAAVADETAYDKIFSYETYKTYWKHTKYFLRWMKLNHPECTTMKSAKKYVNEWLQSRVDQGLSAWTIHTEAAAMNKLFQVDRSDPERFQTPKRRREDIIRSRVSTARDKHFSVTNNDELIKFCRGTGCRRGVLEKLEGRDLWSRERMMTEVELLEKRADLSGNEKKHLAALQDALTVFPEQDYFVHHRKDKNGRYRFAPIIGPDKNQIVQRMKDTGKHEKVWMYIHSGADVHGYRADYANRIYKMFARDVDSIPYDTYHHGLGAWIQSEVYICRKDEAGKRLDKQAMLKCSKALGHNRIDVVAINYLRGL